MTADAIRNELITRLGPIEERVAWILQRELAGAGAGPDNQRRLLREITGQLAALRTALELPASTPALVVKLSMSFPASSIYLQDRRRSRLTSREHPSAPDWAAPQAQPDSLLELLEAGV